MSLRTSLNLDFVRMGRVTGPLYDTEAKKLDPLLTFSRASSATRFNSSGVLETVGSGVPRFDFDPVTLQCRGLLMEESRTNLVLHSGDFANAAYTGSGGGVTANYGTAPDGTNTAARYSGGAFRYQMMTVTPGQGYTVSYWVRATSGTQPVVGYNINGSSQTLGNVGTAWTRLNVYAVADGSTGYAGFNGVSTGDILVGGIQVELGFFATSYIPTTDAAATRAADVCYASTLVPWFNPTAGTIAAEHTSPINLTYASRGNRVAVIYQFSDGTFANRMLDYLDTVTNGAVVSGDVIRHFNWGAVTPGIPVKSALRYSTTALSYINGVATAAAGGPVPTGITRLDLGCYHIGTDQLNGHLRRFTYLPHALSDLTLKALTQ